MDAATKAVAAAWRSSYRAAITAEGDEDDKARQDPDAEAREFDKLLRGASIMPFLNEALEGKETAGKEHEIRAKLLGDEARAGVVPFEMLLPPGRYRTPRRCCDHGCRRRENAGNAGQRPRARFHPLHCSPSLGVDAFGSGRFGELSDHDKSGTGAAMKNPGTAQDAAAASFTGYTLDPDEAYRPIPFQDRGSIQAQGI